MKSLEKTEDFVNTGLFAVKFTASWCGPCKKQQPNLDKIENEFPDVQFLSVDVDDFGPLSSSFNVRSVPTLILFKDGVEVNRIIGVTLLESLRTAFRNFTK